MPDYNYSPWYLEAHKDTVEQLLSLADTPNSHAVMTFNDHQEARRYRSYIRGLLACLSLNRPEKAYARALRTLIKLSPTGAIELHIGTLPPGVRIRGAQPQKAVIVATESADTGTLVIDGIITEKRWNEDLQFKLIAIKLRHKPYEDVNKLVFSAITKPNEARALADFLSPEFDPVSMSPASFERPRKIDASA